MTFDSNDDDIDVDNLQRLSPLLGLFKPEFESEDQAGKGLDAANTLAPSAYLVIKLLV